MMQLLPIKGSTPRVSAEDWRYLTLHQEVISDQIGPLLSQYGDLFCEPADCLLAKVSLTTGFHLILKQGPLILDQQISFETEGYYRKIGTKDA